MSFLKSLFYNFVCVFFVNHLIPGIEIGSYAKLPIIEGAIVFAFSVALINSLVFPFLRLFQVPPSYLKMGILTFIISFASYGVINILPIGMKVISIKGFLISACIVWVVAYLTNHMQLLKYRRHLENQKVRERQEKKIIQDEVIQERQEKEILEDEVIQERQNRKIQEQKLILERQKKKIHEDHRKKHED